MKLHEGLYFGKNSISHSTGKKQISMLKSIRSRWNEKKKKIFFFFFFFFFLEKFYLPLLDSTIYRSSIYTRLYDKRKRDRLKHTKLFNSFKKYTRHGRKTRLKYYTQMQTVPKSLIAWNLPGDGSCHCSWDSKLQIFARFENYWENRKL